MGDARMARVKGALHRVLTCSLFSVVFCAVPFLFRSLIRLSMRVHGNRVLCLPLFYPLSAVQMTADFYLEVIAEAEHKTSYTM
jgi:hypothetical protein